MLLFSYYICILFSVLGYGIFTSRNILKIDLENLSNSLYFVPIKQPNIIDLNYSNGMFSNKTKFIKKSEISS